MKLPTFQEIVKDEREMDVYNLPAEGHYLITGPPGSGKTVMALYRAQRLNKGGINQRLVFAVYNRALNQYVSSAAMSLKIEGLTKTWHSWFWSLHWKIARKEPAKSPDNPYIPLWSSVRKELSEERCAKHRLQHIIVDEAQDLHTQFFPLLTRVAEGFTIFADMNQQLKPNEHSVLDDIRDFMPDGFAERKLVRNYRNTKEIAAIAARFYVGHETGIPEAPTRSGQPPVASSYRDVNEAVAMISRYARLNADQTIAVVVKRDSERKNYLRELSELFPGRVQTYGSYDKTTTLDFSRNSIMVLCLHSVKGLEFDAVFLNIHYPSGTLSDLEKMEMYVATSRARTYLAFLYERECPEWMNKYLVGVVRYTQPPRQTEQIF